MERAQQLRSKRALAEDPRRQEQLFGATDLQPLWIAEPYVELAPQIRASIEERAKTGWFGYETRPRRVLDAFWDWMEERHGWSNQGFSTSVSPSVGTSIGVLIDRFTDETDKVLLQPPVFTDFKPIVKASGREVERNPLVLDGDSYRMDLDGLAKSAADESVRLMILCTPHNPVGRAWRLEELRAVAEICAANDVIVIADEIHADLVLEPNAFIPFAKAAAGTGVTWAATHGPIKTFGLAGVCDTLLITDSEDVSSRFREANRQLHLTRNNVFAIAAFEAAYRTGASWLDSFLADVSQNLAFLRDRLQGGLRFVEPEATYLAWLDLRALGLDVPGIQKWITGAGLALSPGHWFGREGAGFARMTVAIDRSELGKAVDRLNRAAVREN